MARYTGAVCRMCRREQTKLFLKGDRCLTDKCAAERRPQVPGMHGRARPRKMRDYGIQLREKQKMRRYYGLMEKQFRLTFKQAERRKGITGENLLQALELRLDSVVYSLGFAASRPSARQLINHGHVLVDGKKVSISSYAVREGAAISIRDRSRGIEMIKHSVENASRRGIPGWLSLSAAEMKGRVESLPTREDFTMPFQEHLAVELSSQ